MYAMRRVREGGQKMRTCENRRGCPALKSGVAWLGLGFDGQKKKIDARECYESVKYNKCNKYFKWLYQCYVALQRILARNSADYFIHIEGGV